MEHFFLHLHSSKPVGKLISAGRKTTDQQEHSFLYTCFVKSRRLRFVRGETKLQGAERR